MPNNKIDAPLVCVKNLCFKRGSRVIFDGLSLDIAKGKITAILGPSGTGKTTLLKMIGAQLVPDSGEITLFGESLAQSNRKKIYALRKRVGVLFQSGALFSDMSVFDNVAFVLREHTNLSEDMIKTLVLLKLEAVGLRGAATQMPTQLSGGQARRAALARAISLEPELVMYDEPFAGQDPIGMGILVKLIKTLNECLNLTSLVITHDVTEVLSIADYVYLMSDGKVIEHGDTKTIMESTNPWVVQFLNGQDDGPVPFHLPRPDLKETLLA
ncbi:organic solvent ABC transporter ATP-binding protein [Gammaproteobacteria bacterium]|nr:organic solvent ABC transporter ATP-binding protein [Gammaproteobacteria bacterium]